MANTAETLVINNIEHRGIFTIILLIFFGTVLLYSIFSIFALKRRMKLLSKIEGMILEGHKKLVDNREELFVEDMGVLGANFLLDEITENDKMLENLDPEAVAKRERKAAERQKKRDALDEKARVRSEKKRMRAEAAEARRMTPEKLKKKQAREILVYEAAYNVFAEGVNRELEETKRIITELDKKNEKRYAYINSKYKNAEKIKRMKAQRKAKEDLHNAKIEKRARNAAKRASDSADIRVFSRDDI